MNGAASGRGLKAPEKIVYSNNDSSLIPMENDQTVFLLQREIFRTFLSVSTGLFVRRFVRLKYSGVSVSLLCGKKRKKKGVENKHSFFRPCTTTR